MTKLLNTSFIIILTFCLSLSTGLTAVSETTPHLHPGVNHSLVEKTVFNCEVELDDGSLWHVSVEDREKIENWQIGSGIVIYPFEHSHFRYDLQNIADGSMIQVRFYGNAHELSKYEIIAINPQQHEITLQDGSIWRTPFQSKLYTWKVGDKITIGINFSQDSQSALSHPYILINTSGSTSLRMLEATCLNVDQF